MSARTAVAAKSPQKLQRELEDLQLVLKARNGSQSALDQLMRRYHGFVRLKASSYFLAGGDADDLIQEGMIGLYKAMRDFRHDKETSFRSFAELCVTRQMITAVKTATRHKHTPLNGYVSLNRSASSDEDGERLLSDILAAREICDPADIVISAWESEFIRRGVVESLSSFEAQVLRLYMDGRSYQEIADRLGRHAKSVDNALQRVKRKIEQHRASRDVAETA
jgi:RNA polymerase sporulation-specific sigma factor